MVMESYLCVMTDKTERRKTCRESHEKKGEIKACGWLKFHLWLNPGIGCHTPENSGIKRHNQPLWKTGMCPNLTFGLSHSATYGNDFYRSLRPKWSSANSTPEKPPCPTPPQHRCLLINQSTQTRIKERYELSTLISISKKATRFVIARLLNPAALLLHSVLYSTYSTAEAVHVALRPICITARTTVYPPRYQKTSPHCRVGRSVKPNKLGGHARSGVRYLR